LTQFRTELQKVYEKCKNYSLIKYLKNHILQSPDVEPLNSEAFEVFQDIFKNLIKKYVGKDAANLIIENELVVKTINTADHIGTLHYDFALMLGANIVANLDYLLSNDMSKMIPSLTFSNIPFSNVTLPGTINPAGISSPKNPNVRLQPIQLKGKSKATPLYSSKITGESIARALKFYDRIIQNLNPRFNFLNSDILKKFVEMINSLPGRGDTFNAQAVNLSYDAWLDLFNFKIGPHFLIPIEDVSHEMIKKGLIENFLTKKDMRESMLKDFRNIVGAFTVDNNGEIAQGTHFYWAIDENGRRYPMKIEGEYLNSTQLDFQIHISEIPEYLKKHQIDESLCMTLFNACLFPGIKPIGGFNQVEYLFAQKNAWIKTFNAVGMKEYAKKLGNFPTNYFNAGILVAFNADGRPKTGSQIILEGGFDKQYLQKVANTNFGNALKSAQPIINSMIGGKKPDYSRVREILKENKLEHMIY
jgi:hypothetical protein